MSLFLRQWRAEMWKLLARKRTYLGFGAFVLLEILIFVFYHLKGGDTWIRAMVQRNGEVFERYNSCLTLALIILIFAVILMGAIYLTLVAGDVVAKESEDGVMRLLLARPVSRLRLMTVKFASCIVYTFVLMQFITWTALVLGLILRGWGGGLFIIVPERGIVGFFDATEGLKRYALGTLMLSLSMMTTTSIAFFFSCWRIKPATATISAMSYLLIDLVLRESHFMDNYKSWLITHHMSAWTLIFVDEIPWAILIRDYTVLIGISLTLFVCGAIAFEIRDVKS